MTIPRLLTLAAILAGLAAPAPARAWGDEGHEIVAIIADALLKPDTRRRVHAMLAADQDPLTDHDIANEATWADHLRSADPDGARRHTRQWHFVNIELAAPSLDAACFDHPRLEHAETATLGPAEACILDKINQFSAELGTPGTLPEERLAALKFLLHFVADLHQPLHTADADDRGGNDKRVSAPGLRANNLHHYWDTEFVRALGTDPATVAANLLTHLSVADVRRWSAGTPLDWTRESFDLARRDAYGKLPPLNARSSYRLEDAYVGMAIQDCRQQLAKAGIRLATILNRTLH